jgi:Leucine-rich repeat (LRR) protein
MHGCLGLAPQTLWLSDNYISRISGLDSLASLRELHLARNDISNIGDGLAACSVLEKLNLADNRVGSFKVGPSSPQCLLAMEASVPCATAKR